MLELEIPSVELFDENKNEFIKIDSQIIKLEHSLHALSKWESKWKKPFLNSTKSVEETNDYVNCMVLTENVNPYFVYAMTNEMFEKINSYIEHDMTATWFSKSGTNKHSREIITAEVIYYWMISLNIPMECEYWHLNKLLTLIRVCNEKNSPKKKMSKSEILKRNRELNEQRKKLLNTNG